MKSCSFVVMKRIACFGNFSLFWLIARWIPLRCGVAQSIGSDAPSAIPSDFSSNIPSDFASGIPTVFPSTLPAPDNETSHGSCYDTIAAFSEVMLEAPLSERKVFVLCPNTVFTIGFFDANGGCCDDGDLLLAPRNNTRIQCGIDGSSNNNCTITSGQLQLVHEPDFEERPNQFVEIVGLTFTNSSGFIHIYAATGDITFIDCIFKVRSKSHKTILAHFACAGSSFF
jgi:hypothetical protein